MGALARLSQDEKEVYRRAVESTCCAAPAAGGNAVPGPGAGWARMRTWGGERAGNEMGRNRIVDRGRCRGGLCIVPTIGMRLISGEFTCIVVQSIFILQCYSFSFFFHSS